MKIKSDFVLRDMGDMCIVVAVGETARDFNGVINLNASAKFFWKLLEKGCTKEELIEAVCAEYDAERAVIEADVERFIATLQKENILDE